jgi:hypothetical protein
MRDSNSRGLAPNTLSKSVDVRSRQVSAVCDLELRPGTVLCGCSRTAANETRTETGRIPCPRWFSRGSVIRCPPPAPTWASDTSTICLAQDHPAYIPRGRQFASSFRSRYRWAQPDPPLAAAQPTAEHSAARGAANFRPLTRSVTLFMLLTLPFLPRFRVERLYETLSACKQVKNTNRLISAGVEFNPAIPCVTVPDRLIRRFLCGRPDPFRTVRDLGQLPARLSREVRRIARSFVRVAPSVAPKKARSRLRSPAVRSSEFVRPVCLDSIAHRMGRRDHSAYIPDHETARDRLHGAGDGPRPVRAGSGLALGFWPECPQRPPASSVTSRVRSAGTFCCARCPRVTVTLDAGGADTYTPRAIPGSEPRQDLHVPL